MEGASTEKWNERQLFELGKKFLEAAATGDVETVRAMVDAGFPVNFQDPRNRLTALHNACAQGQSDVVRVLVKSGKCNYLLADSAGRSPYGIASELCEQPAITRLMLKKSYQQADRDEIDFWETFYPARR